MTALILIMVLTALGVFIGGGIGANETWLDYYIGGMGGLLFSGILLHFSNKRRRAKELEAEKNTKRRKK